MEQKSKNPLMNQKVVEDEKIIRILSKDIGGNKKIYVGLTKIKGISWGISNAICRKLGLDKHRKMMSLTEDEIKKIESFTENFKIPGFLMNRKFDFDSGENKHLIGSDLELRTDFDIKRLKKIRTYRGVRHATGQPVRGQRTRSHFRSNRRKGTGIKKKESK